MAPQRLPMTLKTLFIAAELARKLRENPKMTREQAVKSVQYLVPTEPESGETQKDEDSPLKYADLGTVTSKEANRAMARLHRVLGRRLFAAGKKPGPHFEGTNEKVDEFLRHVDDLLQSYNAITKDLLGLVDTATVYTYTSTVSYLLPTVLRKISHRMGLRPASKAVRRTPFHPTSVQHIQVIATETTADAIRQVREGRAAFALVAFDESLRGSYTGHGSTPKSYAMGGMIAEPLPFVEPELGIIYRVEDERGIFGPGGSDSPELIEVLARNTLVLHGGSDPLSDLLRRIHLDVARKHVPSKSPVRRVVVQSPSFRHARSLVQEGIGISVGERPVGDADDACANDIRFKPFSEFTIDRGLKAELLAAAKPLRFALYYRKSWDKSMREGGILPIARVMMDCIREVCRNELGDVYEKAPQSTGKTGAVTAPLIREFVSRLVYQQGADGKKELVARLCL